MSLPFPYYRVHTVAHAHARPGGARRARHCDECIGRFGWELEPNADAGTWPIHNWSSAGFQTPLSSAVPAAFASRAALGLYFSGGRLSLSSSGRRPPAPLGYRGLFR